MLPENQQIIHPIDKVYKAVTSYLTGNTTNTHQVAVLLLMTALYLYGRGIRWVIWALHLNQNHLQTNTWQESVTSKYARNKEWLHSKHFFLSVLFFFFSSFVTNCSGVCWANSFAENILGAFRIRFSLGREKCEQDSAFSDWGATNIFIVRA